MKVSEAIEKRKSVRAYLDRPVLSDDLEKIVEAGRWAPNAGPFHVSVVRSPGLRQKINDRTHGAMLNSPREFLRQRAALPGYQPLYAAPVVILISGPEDAAAPHSARNASLAAENMILQATELGLGTCYLVSPTLALNGPDNRDLAHEAGVPEGYAVQCAIAVGYAAAENRYAVGERARKGSVSYVD